MMQKTETEHVANNVTTSTGASDTNKRSTSDVTHTSSTTEPYAREGESGAPPNLRLICVMRQSIFCCQRRIKL